jgi:hypothetical protein
MNVAWWKMQGVLKSASHALRLGEDLAPKSLPDGNSIPESPEKGTYENCENSPNTVHLRNSKLSGTQMVSAGGALRS